MNKNTTDLTNLAPNPGSRHRRKRLGLGEGSGSGKTSGRGTKGAGSRSGYRLSPGFEGGQMPLYRRLPKVGFTSRKKVLGENVFRVVSLGKLSQLGLSGDVSLEKLQELGVVKGGKKLKVLAGGTCPANLKIEAHGFSRSAEEAIRAAGGEARLIA